MIYIFTSGRQDLTSLLSSSLSTVEPMHLLKSWLFVIDCIIFYFSHLFRRLRWLNSKPGAHLVTLTYLAVWHGYHLGYFLLFFFEFACVMAEQQVDM